MTTLDYIFSIASVLLIGFIIGYFYTYRQLGKKIMMKELDRHYKIPMREALGKFSTTFHEDIEKLSPTFCEIFNQASTAEQDGLSQICGIGFGKSLEFLIKDYSIQLHPHEKQAIEKIALGKCIQKYMLDDSIREIAELATWLRNDEAHYVRKWTQKDLIDLKNLITLTVTIIHSNLKKRELDNKVQEIKTHFNNP
jgi:hypothetical protein